ncbi:MAG: hypothetical protein BGN86_14280 [Caulobacterales bacterium 68-7]|nr:MAG: hypothetical protein BGN86_14280 [Caulobacterales bacterium 68-7]
MTDDRIEGVARAGLGRIQDAAGGLVGDPETQARGKLNQAAGRVQDAFGKAKNRVTDGLSAAGDYSQDTLEDLADIVRERPLTAVGVTLGVGVLLGLLIDRLGR